MHQFAYWKTSFLFIAIESESVVCIPSWIGPRTDCLATSHCKSITLFAGAIWDARTRPFGRLGSVIWFTLYRPLFLTQLTAYNRHTGACARIPISGLATGFIREALLDPSLLLRLSDEWRSTFPPAKVHSKAAGWLPIVRHLFDIGMICFLPFPNLPFR